jgi:hypothetical protein
MCLPVSLRSFSNEPLVLLAFGLKVRNAYIELEEAFEGHRGRRVTSNGKRESSGKGSVAGSLTLELIAAPGGQLTRFSFEHCGRQALPSYR